MRPTHYTQLHNGDAVFHYPVKFLREFLKRGKSHGDVGPLLVKVNGEQLHYKCFGTIEHPSKELSKILLTSNPAFNETTDPNKICQGDMQDNKPYPMLSSYSYVVIDYAEDTSNIQNIYS